MSSPVWSLSALLPIRFALATSVLLIAANHSHGQIAWQDIGPKTETIDLETYSGFFHVSQSTGSDQDGDGSRESPWNSIDRAIERIGAPLADGRSAVLVAGGTYRGKTLKMQSNLDLFGGFDPETWKRDIFEHESILDGEHLRRVVIGASRARIDGFVIIRGRAEGHGGGMLCDSSSPTITNNRFEINFARAPDGFRHDRFDQEGHGGGALACLYDATPIISNNSFIGNWTEIGRGGAILFMGRVRLSDSPRAVTAGNLFYRNSSGREDRHATRSSGGGAIAVSHEANPIIRGNALLENQAKGGSDGGAIHNAVFASPEIKENWIVGNRSDDDGAGFYTSGLGDPVLLHNVIAGNRSTGNGISGVASGADGRITLINNTIVHNESGGGVFLFNTFSLVEGNIIAENLGGPGLRFSQRSSVFAASLISGNAFRGNEKGPFFLDVSEGESPILEGNHLEGGRLMNAAEQDSIPELEIQVDGLEVDPKRVQTTLILPDDSTFAGQLAGRLARFDDRWTVVIADTANSMTVIGDLTPSEDPTDSGTAGRVTLVAVYPLPGDIEITAPGFDPGPDPAAAEETERQEAAQP